MKIVFLYLFKNGSSINSHIVYSKNNISTNEERVYKRSVNILKQNGRRRYTRRVK